MSNYSEEDIKYMEEILNKIKNKESLDQEELWNVLFEYDIYTEEEDDDRWYRYMSTISKLNNTYVVTNWKKGLTEYQDSEYDGNPIIVTEVKTEEIKMYRHTIYLDDDTTLIITNNNPEFMK